MALAPDVACGSLLAAAMLLAATLAAGSLEPSCHLEDGCAHQVGRSLLQRRTDSALIHEALPGRQPHVCILARTCGPQAKCAPHGDPVTPAESTRTVRAFLASISAQNYSSWELHLLNGQGGGEVYTDLVASLGDNRIISGPSAPQPFAKNTWGYEATNYAVNKLFAANAPCEYFLFTNADNLYAKGFLETGQPGMQQGRDLLGFNFVTRYVQVSNPPRPSHMRAHMPMEDAGFELGHIDLGAVLVSAKAMQETGTRFSETPGDPRTDWNFFQAIMQRPGSTGTAFYPELHYIHQLLQVKSEVLPEAPAVETNLKSSAPAHKKDESTLFYHVHVPRTGGTTVASLLLTNVCSPQEEQVTYRYHGNPSLCNHSCPMGLTDNELSCFPGRLDIEHKPFDVNLQRARGLQETSGAKKIVFVTTLRRGSDRLKSQWALESMANLWAPPAGVASLSNESLQIYLNGGAHEGQGWSWSAKTISQNNNRQVAQLASVDPNVPVTRQHLEIAKQVLLQGEWVIGFTKCLDKVHEKLKTYSDVLHGAPSQKVMQRALGHEPDEGILNAETHAQLESQCALDNELFDWAWKLAETKTDPRFAGTC